MLYESLLKKLNIIINIFFNKKKMDNLNLKYLSSDENIKKELAEYFNRITKKIKNGYEVINREQDGCDEYGHLYWVDCKNGWCGREHSITSECRNDIFSKIIEMCDKPITIYCKKVYIDDSLANHCKTLPVINKNHINILTEEEFLNLKSEVLFLNDIKKYLIDVRQKTIKYSIQYKYPVKDILTSSIKNFTNYIKINMYNYLLKDFVTKGLESYISNFKNLSKDETHKILFILDNLNN